MPKRKSRRPDSTAEKAPEPARSIHKPDKPVVIHWPGSPEGDSLITLGPSSPRSRGDDRPVASTATSMTASPEPFEQLAPRIIQQLRSALAALIAACPGNTPIRKAADLERALEIPSTLAWRVFTFAQADEPLARVGNVPGPGAMNRVIAAAADRGVASQVVTAAQGAFAEFEDLVKVHAGTRAALDSMISGLKIEGSDQIDLQHKRAAFNAYSHIWGVQAQTQLSCFILRASVQMPSRLDVIGLRGLVGLRRLRRDVSWVVSSMRVCDDDGKTRTPISMSPLDQLEPDSTVPLLRDFSSHPLPRFRTVKLESGYINTLIEPTTVGNQSAVTCLFGSTGNALMARHIDEHNKIQATLSFVRTPSEVLVHDVMVQPGTFDQTPPKVLVYGDHRGVDAFGAGRECDLLALRETVVHLGRGPDVMHTADVPRYTDLVRYAFDHTGWDPSEFDVYRCRVEYPVMPSSVVVQFDLLPGDQPDS